MIITRLTLDNFGLFPGRQDFFLRPELDAKEGESRPIVLVGGMNGSGKTTFFEAIKLCLYGPLALGERVRTVDFERYLLDRLHRGPDGHQQAQHAGVELEFEHIHAGLKQTYRIRREWHRHGEHGVEQSLSLWRDGALVTDLDPAHWQDFVKELIPPGIAQLFFFDGERIQSLAEDEDNYHLAESIKSLLGLALVDRLHSDLAIYIRKQQQSDDHEQLEELQQAEAEIEALNAALEECLQDRAQLESKLEHLRGKVDHQEERITSEGGQFAEQRDQFKTRQAELDAEIREVEDQIRQLAEGLLPFAMTPALCRSLQAQLQREDAYQRWQASVDYLKQQQPELAAELTSDDLLEQLGLSPAPTHKVVLEERINAALERLTAPNAELEDTAMVHALSQPEQQRLLSWIAQSLNETPKRFLDLSQRLENLIRERQQVERNLKRVPADEVLKPLLSELHAYHESLSELKTQAKALDDRQRPLTFQLEEAQRRKRKADEAKDKGQKAREAIENANQVRKVLEAYSQRLTRTKVETLAQTVTECFNKLCRKQDWIDHIRIDPKDYSVTLFDDKNRAIPKNRLSAGEKQVYAIAMLWGLGITSGRPLPVIIDTPLGRLDSSHRQQLVDNYFPHASHQMILLSTDTEVDQAFFGQLEPHITMAYHLEYDPKQSRSLVSEGYFWDKALEGAARAA